MHKLIYLLPLPAGADRAGFVAALMALGGRLAERHPPGLRLNVQDAGVDHGAAVEHHPALGRSSAYGPFEAVIQLWLEDASAPSRAPFEALIAEVAPVHHGYRVEERLLVHNLRQSAKPGERNDGYSQIAVLQIPDALSYETWLGRWRDRHTWVALSIHPHLEYIQNLVVEAVTADAPPIAGVGEEQFPIEGLHDERPLFRGGDDDAKFKALYEIMYEDAARFIDFDRLDMLVTSQFDLPHPPR
jgi:hypothetical protein